MPAADFKPSVFGSAIAPDLLGAYLETIYRVFSTPPFDLRVGQRSLALADACHRSGVSCCAFVTACNPFSRYVSRTENLRRMEALRRDLSARDFRLIPGLGFHPTGKWPGEASFLVLGLTLRGAREVGENFGQNAVLWAGLDAKPELILLR